MNISLTQSTAKHFLSKDTQRPAMHGVYFDCGAKKMALTNGYVLLTVDFDPDPGMPSFIAPLAALPKKREAEITFDGDYIRTSEKGQPAAVTTPIDEQYPDWIHVIPEFPDERPGVTAIGFTPSFFAGFAAVTKNLGGIDIRLDFSNAKTAVKVSPIASVKHLWEGILMPTRMN